MKNLIRISDIKNKELRKLAFLLAKENHKDDKLSDKEIRGLGLAYAFPWSQTQHGYAFWQFIAEDSEDTALKMERVRKGMVDMSDKRRVANPHNNYSFDKVPHNPFTGVAKPIFFKNKPKDIEIDRHVTKRTLCIAELGDISLRALAHKLTVIPPDIVVKTSNLRVEGNMIVCDYSEREAEVEKMERIYIENKSKKETYGG